MILDKINADYRRIVNQLQDEKSKKIFDSRLEYMITRNEDKLEEDLFDVTMEYECWEVDSALGDDYDREIVIFGSEKYGRKTLQNLKRCRKPYNILAFSDNNKEKIGKEVEGIPIMPINVLYDRKNVLFIVASVAHGKDICQQLIRIGIDSRNIIVPTLGYPEIQCGWQYFDVFEPKEREILLDAGTYDGKTIVDFYKWLGAAEGRCYGLEPVGKMYEKANRLLIKEKIKNAKIFNIAAWSKQEELSLTIDEKTNGDIWGGECCINKWFNKDKGNGYRFVVADGR